MRIVLVVITIFVSLIQSSFSQVVKSNSQKLLEALDGFCVQNTDDFSNIDRMSKLMNFIKASDTIKNADPAINNNGGNSYYGEYEGTRILVGYVNNGGCTIATKSLNVNEFTKLLKKNFQIKSLQSIKEGTQIQDFFKIKEKSIYGGGIFSITYGKKEMKSTVGSIAYLPRKVVNKLNN